MKIVTTDWTPCGLRQRRAVISADTFANATDAARHYTRLQKDHMGTDARIDRAVLLYKNYGARITHEYNPE